MNVEGAQDSLVFYCVIISYVVSVYHLKYNSITNTILYDVHVDVSPTSINNIQLSIHLPIITKLNNLINK